MIKGLISKKKILSVKWKGICKQGALLLFAAFTAPWIYGQSYIQDGKAVSIAVDVNNHHARFLNNRENQTSFLSYYGRLGYHFSLSRILSFNQQFGIGVLQNAHEEEAFWTKTLSLDYRMTVSMNIPKFFNRTYNKAFIPYGFTGYQFQYFRDQTAFREQRFLTSFLIGAGLTYPVKPNTQIILQSGVAQRLGFDFQTTLQNQIGLQLSF